MKKIYTKRSKIESKLQFQSFNILSTNAQKDYRMQWSVYWIESYKRLKDNK